MVPAVIVVLMCIWRIKTIHCGAHRIALASSQAAPSIPYLKRFDGHLNTSSYHFDNRSVQEATLHQVQTVLDEPVLCLKTAFTRWLSHNLAITAIHKTTLIFVMITLEKELAENDNATARGLLHALKSYNL